MQLSKEGKLSTCLIETNCILVEWSFRDINQTYERLIKIASQLPRTNCLEKTSDYWHGVCRSLIFRFPDDLEVLKLPKSGIIQVRSASRFGLGDLGVNKNRVNSLYRQLRNEGFTS